MSLNFGPNPKVYPNGTFNPAIDPTFGSWKAQAPKRWQGFNANNDHPLPHGSYTTSRLQIDSLEGNVPDDVAETLTARLGWNGNPISFLEAQDLDRLVDPNTGKPWSWTLEPASATDGGSAPGPAPTQPDHTSDEPYESEHTVSKTITIPYIRGAAHAMENHRTGINHLLDITGSELTPELRDRLKASKARGLNIWEKRVKPAYDAGIPAGDQNPVGTLQGRMLAQGNLCQDDADEAFNALMAAELAIFKAQYPQTVEGWNAFSRTPVYLTIWKAARANSEATWVAMLVGKLDPWTPYRDQDPLRHLVIGSGGGGFGAGGQRS